jgi:hypothetical protein
MHLLRKCPCPLWLLKPDIAPHYNKVVANVDIQQSDSVAEPSLNQQIIEMASAFAIHNNAEFYILNAWQPEPAGMVLMWCDNPEQAEAEFNQSVYQSQQTAMTKFKNQTISWLGQQAFDFTKPQFELLRGEPTKILTERISKIAPGLSLLMNNAVLEAIRFRLNKEYHYFYCIFSSATACREKLTAHRRSGVVFSDSGTAIVTG